MLSNVSNMAKRYLTTFQPKPPSGSGPTVSYIDFASSSPRLAKQYSGSYALVIDNLFSEEECTALIALAETTEAREGKGWQPAKINGGPRYEDQFLDTEYRFNDRILRFDHEAARKIYERVLPFLEGDIGEIQHGHKWDRIVGARGGVKVEGTWKMVG